LDIKRYPFEHRYFAIPNWKAFENIDYLDQWILAIVTIHVPYSIPPAKRYPSLN
jgi:hypothetical protein